jgi:uncharacterized protein involved in type VI secretion and phage assembly
VTGAAIGLIAPVVKMNGAELSSQQIECLQSLSISRGLRLPARAALQFADPGFAMSAAGTFALGNEVVVSTSDGTALFTGNITGLNIDLEFGTPSLSVIADDPSYKMTLGTKVRTFTNMTYSAVVGQIAREHGLALATDPTNTSYEYLMQSDTDFGFLTEMADRAGYDWWVEADKTLHFKMIGSVTDQPQLTWGLGLRHFAVRASGLHPGQITVTGWDPNLKQNISANSVTPQPDTTANLLQQFLAPSGLGANAAVTAADQAGTSADASMLADRLAERWLAGAVTAFGTAEITPGLVPGGKVEVVDAGPLSGVYAVTEVEHTYSLRGFETRFTAGARQPRTLVDTLSGAIPSSFRRTGLMIGVVTNISDPDGKGRVKVKFASLGDDVESEWARVVSVGAGSSRGLTFLPEVNDEVIVGFEGDDIARPLVFGGLYNGRDVGLDYGVLDGKVQKRQIVSRSGHVVELADGDAPADQHIGLTLAGGAHKFYLGKDKMLAQVPAGLPTTISAGDTKIDIDQAGNLTLQAPKITIKATTDVEISGVNITLKATAKLAGSASAQLQMSGTAQAEFSSAGQTAVKGAIVMIN